MVGARVVAGDPLGHLESAGVIAAHRAIIGGQAHRKRAVSLTVEVPEDGVRKGGQGHWLGAEVGDNEGELHPAAGFQHARGIGGLGHVYGGQHVDHGHRGVVGVARRVVPVIFGGGGHRVGVHVSGVALDPYGVGEGGAVAFVREHGLRIGRCDRVGDISEPVIYQGGQRERTRAGVGHHEGVGDVAARLGQFRLRARRGGVGVGALLHGDGQGHLGEGHRGVVAVSGRPAPGGGGGGHRVGVRAPGGAGKPPGDGAGVSAAVGGQRLREAALGAYVSESVVHQRGEG